MEESYNQTSAYKKAGCVKHFKDTKTILIVDSVIFTVALPVLCVAIYGFYSLVKSNHVCPLYVMNILISDLIQISVRLIESALRVMLVCDFHILFLIYWFSLTVNIIFMVCISAERYAMIAHPFWYSNFQAIRTSVFVSITAWVLAFIIIIPLYWVPTFVKHNVLLPLTLLSPYPLVMFFSMGTWRAFPRTSLTPDKQRRIMGTLALVLFIYTISFLPSVVVFLDGFSDDTFWLRDFPYILAGLNPLFDCVLYVIMRRDANSVMGFCCGKRRGESTTTTVTQEEV